ncbi:MAG: class I SAM-dependent methyltransferase [Lachnospiraceae bacterium]|nr:class I SAM-dependent methyltransferase [Lachnospiraceae bacterium]
METIVSMVTPKLKVVDVGCDHAFIDIALVERGIAPSALAMDVKKGPLEHADENIREAGLSEKIKTRLSDGLQKYERGEADCLIISGMGGPLIQKILLSDLERLDNMRDFKEMIFSPQSEITEFREFLSSSGYRITDEDMVCEDSKYYNVIKTVPEGKAYELTNEALRYGPCLIDKRHPVLEEYLKKQLKNDDTILCKLSSGSDSYVNRIKKEEIQKESDIIKGLLADWGIKADDQRR